MQLLLSSLKHRLTRQFTVSAAVLAAAFVLQSLLRNRIGEAAPLAFLISAVACVAVCFGAIAGFIATGGSALTAAVFLLPPVNSIRISSLEDRWQLFFFLLEGVTLSWLCAGYRISSRRGREALSRERAACVEARELAQSASTSRRSFERERAEWFAIADALAAHFRAAHPLLSADLAGFAAAPSPFLRAPAGSRNPADILDSAAADLAARHAREILVHRDGIPALSYDAGDLRSLFELILELPVSLAAANETIEISLAQSRIPGAAAFNLSVTPSCPAGPRPLLRLAACRRRIDAMNGRIWDGSLLACGGNNFVFSLPLPPQ